MIPNLAFFTAQSKAKCEIEMPRVVMCVFLCLSLSSGTGICEDVLCKGKYDPRL